MLWSEGVKYTVHRVQGFDLLHRVKCKFASQLKRYLHSIKYTQ